MVKVLAPAKINLTLHVTGRRDDGYHLLDSLVVFADIGDTVRVKPSDTLSLSVEGRMTAGVPLDERNIMIRAAQFMHVGAEMRLTKKLPNAAGLGGGSSDAAATLKALSELTGKPIPENPLALGADVPVCLVGRAARMRGIGESVEPLHGLPKLHAVLVNPNRPAPTKTVFKKLESHENPPMPEVIPSGQSRAEFITWLKGMRNDLEAPAIAVEPVIAQVFKALEVTPGCRLARMSGSGATCFGLYDNRETARAAAGRLREQQPGWWVAAARLNAGHPSSRP
ncbi:4-(cytidine 5'-diphospho)-2-C-methyl-D-erythritol kinase [Roseovarius faecimaris]|nr:4-(cytidine 5'-diphospho)-2-C-methyl-D-erythritol kinase [Roseovarius faecimaris]